MHPLIRRLVIVLTMLTGCDAPLGGQALFEQQIAPILQARCASTICHGVAVGAEAAGEHVDWTRLFFRVDANGALAEPALAYATAKRAINTTEDPAFSSLLRKPLPVAFGGHPHHGKDNFTSPMDPDYQALRAWITSERDGGEVPPELTPNQVLFGETVQTALVSGVCMNANCHGLGAAIPYRLRPGIGGVFSAAATQANYLATLSMLSLDGDPLQSRLLRKALPLHAGGVVHKGGNALFTGLTDPRVQAIRRWICVEREDRLGARCEAPAPGIEGFVFIRGPLEPANAFQLDTFVPGSDLFLATLSGDSLVPNEVINLTATLHDAPADIRDPAVDPEGRAVLFSMRTGPDTGHNLYELDLHTRSARQLTDDAGPLPNGGMRTHRDPTYGPTGDIWFVSTRAGVLTDRGDVLDADLYQLNPQSGAITRRTYTPHAERKPVFLVHGEENGGEVAFTALREAVPEQRRAHPFRFPPDLSTEYHQHFGITPPENFFHDLRELPDGRYAVTIGDLSGVWRAGRLGIIDRNFGPEIPSTLAGANPGMPFYAPPLVRLDPEAAAEGVSVGLYRDVAPLPDGRLLVAYAPQTIDLADPGAVFDLRIEALTLAEALDGSGPTIVDRAVLVDAPGVADRDPEPIMRRQAAPTEEHAKWDPEAETGRFFHNGLPLIDALLGNLPPTGPKASTAAFRYVRLIEALQSTPAHRVEVPADEIRHHHPGATSVSLAPLDRARVLAELPLAEDGTFQVELPAGIPIRVQGLDADRMAVGAMHNRWFYVAPGQKLVQGASADVYKQRCSACHGAADGDPDHTFVQPDVLTTASVTLSRYNNRDPRRPLPLPLAGPDTRIEVDFVADVQPILNRCAVAPCHAGAAAAAGLDLSDQPTEWFNNAYETLLDPARDLVDLRSASARRSHLIELLTGRELLADRTLQRPGQPHPADLEPDALLTLIRWIELGAAWRGTP